MLGASDILNVNVNVERLNTVLNRYTTEIGLAPEKVTRAQAGLVMRELTEQSNPKNRSELDAKIDKDVGKVYGPAPRSMLPLAHRQGKGFVYLAAGPNFLLAAKNNNAHLGDSLSDLQRLFHRSRGIIKGNRYIDRGLRGKQHLVEHNRIVVRRGVLNDFKRWLKTRVGILGGSWAVAWDFLKPSGRRPAAFKMRHVTNQTAKGTFINGIGLPGKSTFTLINRATGVESNNSLRTIAAVLIHRAEAVKVDIKNILSGAYKRAGWKRRTG